MYSLRFKCAAEEVDLLSSELWEAGTAGIRELDDGEGVILIAGFETNHNRAELLKQFAGRDTHWEQEDATDWVAETHLAWPSRLVGERIFLAPPWCEESTPLGRVRVIHNPGLACGTGEHPCTQLALVAIEAAHVEGKLVVDIGTGSGVLAIAALRLGARIAVGVDTDEAALAAARENFELNGFRPLLAAGSADCLRCGCADVVISNISGTILLSVADELLRLCAAHARLILSGFSEYELAAIEQHIGSGVVTSCGEWRCLNVQLS